ncbi:MAG TPA: proline dehydrogenase family protein [Actinocatenispora sp.]
MALDRSILFRLVTNEHLERAVRFLPQGEALAWRLASRYVAGRTLDDAVRVVGRLHELGVAAAVDQFGELVTDPAVADSVARDYLDLADRLAGLPSDAWLAVDLTHLGLHADPETCADHLAAIAGALPGGRRIQVGAEDHASADAVLDCVLDAAGRGLADRLGATVQANLRRTPADLDRLVAAGVHIRLVKGAYVEPPERALAYGEPTNLAYLRLAGTLATAGTPFAIATHDGVLREAILAAHGPVPVEQLFGVRPDVVEALVARDIPVRVYVPYGSGWFRYFMRRVAESRGA